MTRVAACFRFTLCLLSLDGDETRQQSQTGDSRRDTNRHCCGSPAKCSHPRETSEQTCNCTCAQLHIQLSSSLRQKVINLKKKNVFIFTFCHFSLCMPGHVYEFHNVSFSWNLPIVYNLLCLFVFSFTTHANIFPSAVSHHPHILPVSAHLCFVPHCHPFLSLTTNAH